MDDGAWTADGSFLAAIGADARHALLQAGTRRRFAAHTVLFHQGDPSTHVVVILTGWVKVLSTSRNGYETLLAIRGPGDVVGELSAVDGSARSATLVTLRPVEAAVLTADRFGDLLFERAELGRAMLSYLALRLREADRRRLEFGAHSVSERLARRLLALAERHGRRDDSRTVIDLPLSQRDLAGAVGASREAVARVLKIFRDRRIVVTHRQRVVIVQPEVLASIGGLDRRSGRDNPLDG